MAQLSVRLSTGEQYYIELNPKTASLRRSSKGL
jgi:hypothetical protein